MASPGVTYYQHRRSERTIVAVFSSKMPFASEFGHPTYPAMYFEHTTLTDVGPRTFSPAKEEHWFSPVAREVAAALYPEHVRWVELLITAIHPETPVPPIAPLTTWPDLQCDAFHLQGSGVQAQAELLLSSSNGQQMSASLTEMQLLRLALRVKASTMLIQSERAEYFIVAFGGDDVHLIPRAKRANQRPRLLCHRLPPHTFHLVPLVEHPLDMGGVCFDCREKWMEMTHDGFLDTNLNHSTREDR